ncbi:uncharacterized protein LOC143222526 isoform X3 [Tachypleus tridentatus]|uniref:uncharacterized protein LOC143222526 isoform X3 n=1 Tax=Tachypleus tridentatus TaxID=6853 RepID=UPI003FD13A76
MGYFLSVQCGKSNSKYQRYKPANLLLTNRRDHDINSKARRKILTDSISKKLEFQKLRQFRRSVTLPDFLRSSRESKDISGKASSKLELKEQCNKSVSDQQKSLEDRERWVSMPNVVHPSSHTEDDIELPTPSKFGLVRLHESRFHRHFPTVSSEEHLVNYYHCALVSDILLQGFLYLSKNYFAFYSNIFGYKTKFLIPVGSVTKITKERTAKIIPNAIGITTHDEKYVFGSLLSRDASYQLLYKIWKKSLCEKGIEDKSFSSSSSDQTTTDDVSSLSTRTKKEYIRKSLSSRSSLSSWYNFHGATSHPGEVSPKCQPSNNIVWSITKDYFGKIEGIFFSIYKIPRTNILLAVSSVLLVLLFLSATFLMYRISVVHRRITNVEQLQPFSILKQKQKKFGQSKIVTEEVIQLTDNLQNRINQLVLVRKSLAELMDVAIQDKNSCNTEKEDDLDTVPGQWVVVGT